MCKTMLNNVITVDGPSGVGKGTLTLWLAKKLNYNILDSGSIYRLASLQVLNTNVNYKNIDDVLRVCEEMEINYNASSIVKVFLNKVDVTVAIRDEKVATIASEISAYSELRNLLLDRQRSFLSSRGLIADGRDMGTVVFPGAKYKFFLDADPKVRAKRRFNQLTSAMRNSSVSYDEIYYQLVERDFRDRNRDISPLVPADDAIIIDTTNKKIAQVQDIVMRYLSHES